MEVSGQLHAPAALPRRERAPGTHWIGANGDATESLTDEDEEEESYKFKSID
jgi:hypothetical protein